MDGRPSWQRPQEMGREAAEGTPASERDPAASFETGASPLTRFPDATKTEDSCAMCGHRRALHTTGTDGAGWCAFPDSCDCGGFPGRLW